MMEKIAEPFDIMYEFERVYQILLLIYFGD